jgi:hypothetical protein
MHTQHTACTQFLIMNIPKTPAFNGTPRSFLRFAPLGLILAMTMPDKTQAAYPTVNITLGPNAQATLTTDQKTQIRLIGEWLESCIAGLGVNGLDADNVCWFGIEVKPIDGLNGIVANTPSGSWIRNMFGKYVMQGTKWSYLDSADTPQAWSLGTITDIIVHEFGHDLGWDEVIWYYNGIYNPWTGEYWGEKGLAAYRALYDPTAEYVPMSPGGHSPQGINDGHNVMNDRYHGYSEINEFFWAVAADNGIQLTDIPRRSGLVSSVLPRRESQRRAKIPPPQFNLKPMPVIGK